MLRIVSGRKITAIEFHHSKLDFYMWHCKSYFQRSWRSRLHNFITTTSQIGGGQWNASAWMFVCTCRLSVPVPCVTWFTVFKIVLDWMLFHHVHASTPRMVEPRFLQRNSVPYLEGPVSYFLLAFALRSTSSATGPKKWGYSDPK